MPVASPVWFPWLLSLVAPRAGITVGSYQRLGLSRVRFHSLDARFGAVQVTADSITIPQPLAWIRSLLLPAPASPANPTWHIQGATVRILPTQTADHSTSVDSVAAALDSLRSAAAAFAWLAGPVHLDNTRIEAAGLSLDLPTVHASTRGVDATISHRDLSLQLGLAIDGSGAVRARLDVQPWNLLLAALAEPDGPAWNLSGTLRRNTDHLAFSARNLPGSWLPESLRIEGQPWTFNPSPPLTNTLHVEATANGTDGHGTFRFLASGSIPIPIPIPIPDTDPATGPVPASLPIETRIEGRITPTAIILDALHAGSTPARIELRQPVTLTLATSSSPPHLSPVDLDLDGDLTSLPGSALTGRWSGTLHTPAGSLSPTHRPVVPFTLTATDVGSPVLTLQNLHLSGSLSWPLLRLDRLAVTTPDDASLTASASANLAELTLAAAEWRFTGPIPLPPSASNTNSLALPPLQAEGTAQGPLRNPRHSGSIQSLAPFHLPGFHPFHVTAHWDGSTTGIDSLRIHATRDTLPASIVLEAHARLPDSPPTRVTGAITTLDILHQDRTDLTLNEPIPFEIDLPAPARPPTPTTAPIAIRLPRITTQGTAGSLEARANLLWPASGNWNLTLADASPRFLEPWLQSLPEPLPHITLTLLSSHGAWSNGPVDATASLDLTAPAPNIGPVHLKATLTAAPDGLHLINTSLAHDQRVGARLKARLPIHIHPQPPENSPPWTFIPDTTVHARLDVGDNPWPWAWLTDPAGISIVEPKAHLELNGPWDNPQLTLHGDIRETRAALPGTTNQSFGAGPITLRASASRDGLDLHQLTATVGGQTLRAEALVPWLPGPRTNTSQLPWPFHATPDLHAATGFVEIPGADPAALLDASAAYVQPGSNLRGRIERQPSQWSGWLELTNLTTRPLPGIGIIRDIHFRLSASGQRVVLEQAQALLGGQPILASGAWTLPIPLQSTPTPPPNPTPNPNPPPLPESFVHITATNLSLVRSPELILRADLDLAITQTNDSQPPLVAGAVTLRDSIVTMDVRKLVAIDLERPSQRPPFFSIDHPLVADWALDVRVRGNRFARILSPVLNASASADLTLRGSLRQPRLVGQAAVDQGRLSFPFGQLDLERFQAVFTESDPFRPRLEGRAEGMNFGYAITMNLDGTLPEPEVHVTSLPPMTTSEVLQMLMTGSLPRNEYAYTTRSKAQNVGTYLAGDLLSQLTGDPFEEPRLSIRSGQRVSAAGRLTYSVEYRISDRWSATAEYDRWSQLGAGIRWRVLER